MTTKIKCPNCNVMFFPKIIQRAEECVFDADASALCDEELWQSAGPTGWHTTCTECRTHVNIDHRVEFEDDYLWFIK